MKLTEPNPASGQSRIDLKRYFSVIGRYWMPITLFVIVVTLIATLLILAITPVYRATATLLIESQASKTISIEEVYALDTSKKEYYQTQFEILRSDYLSEKVIEELGISQIREFNNLVGKPSARDKLLAMLHQVEFLQGFLPKQKPLTDAVDKGAADQAVLKKFKSHLAIEPIRNTQLVRIQFGSADPVLAANVANALGQAYIESNLEARLVATQTASGWITDRLGELKNNLDISELALTQYLQDEGLIELDDIDELAGTELTNLTIRVAEAREKRVAAESLYSLMQGNGAGSAALLSVPEISNHPQVRDVKNAETDAQRKVSELSKRYGEKHDKMIQARAQLTAVRNRANSVINELARGIEKELTNARKQEASLITSLANKKNDYQHISSKRAQYESLKRDVDSSRQLYDMFLSRQKETTATSDFESVIARFTDKAKTAQDPFRPQTTKLIVISAAFALLIAIAGAFLADAYRNTIEKPDDVEEKLGLQHLGFLPRVKAKRFKNTPLDHTLYLDPDAALFSESVRTIRTSILLTLTNSKRKILAVTSSLPAEGKTTVALNLAQSLAKMERTLLIDCDLRMPAIGGRYGLPRNQAGLTNALVMGTPISECIYHDDESSLDLLPAGLLPPNPQELLGSPKFAALIDQLKQSYDRIILDTPPVHVVSDSLLLGRLAGGMVLVVKAESTTEKQINFTVSQLVRHDIAIDGVVLNQLSSKFAEEKYKLHYGYYNANKQSDDALEAS
ncbi:capsular biosynthesis protein CpsD [Enterovibrio norvegicus FF-454]|uniref:non-specific protein-tyrosine kinase n=1 Tax=Enterovibrio norvegicus FF-454 TaxID=1185651 RepID=A0A1E5BXM1_9GAMM|nr:polysaccharide biosynthesis tyrosine autokinase [Enterovibrio norvegicus]OEE57995.1 capsular biosynthesis protein CpsD [Enterovibrio norvegicus FF-454]